ncbi:MAG TPA: hypothetical protein VII06_09575 [Chloroflexota bacterium]|jgi:hypothetical protein
MAVNVGEGILHKMAEQGDHPLRDSDFQQNSDGSVYEKNVGTKGTYVASDASGDWEVVFYPFVE